jgi:hypothetical protein
MPITAGTTHQLIDDAKLHAKVVNATNVKVVYYLTREKWQGFHTTLGLVMNDVKHFTKQFKQVEKCLHLNTQLVDGACFHGTYQTKICSDCGHLIEIDKQY